MLDVSSYDKNTQSNIFDYEINVYIQLLSYKYCYLKYVVFIILA